MPFITTYQNFVGNIMLPQVATSSSPERALLEAAIEKYEPRVLRDVLGVTMYDDLFTHINDPSGIWYDFLNGKSYVNDEYITCYWDGLKVTNPVACYIYYMRQIDLATSTTGIGVHRSSSENMTMQNPTDKMVDAWNTMVMYFEQMHDFLVNSSDDFPDYLGLNFEPFNSYVYGKLFMPHTQNNTKYFEKINAYGI